MIKFFLIVNRSGQLRLSRYYEKEERQKPQDSENSVITTCLKRKSKQQCTFFHQEGLVIIFRQYVNLCLIAGVTPDENELSILELMHNFLETLNTYFENVCELDIMFNLDKVLIILDEIIVNGCVAQTSKERILAPLHLSDASDR